MKRTIAILLCVFMAALLCACTQQGATGQAEPSESKPQQNAVSSDSQTATAPSETNTSEKETKITVDLPGGWEPVEGSTLPAHYIKNGSAVFMVMKVGYPGDTIDAVTELAKASNEKAYDKVEYVGGTENIKVDGNEARKFVCTYDFGGLPMKGLFVYFFHGSDLYQLTFNDFTDTYDSLSDDYAAIMAQIKFE